MCSGIVPYFFSLKVAVNAIQWTIGLELMHLTKNPWQAYSNVWANRINDVYELDEFINSL